MISGMQHSRLAVLNINLNTKGRALHGFDYEADSENKGICNTRGEQVMNCTMSLRSAKAFPLVEDIFHIFRSAFSLSSDEGEEAK